MGIQNEYSIGQNTTAVITNIVSFGAFAKLPNGDSGLIHISEISDCYIKNVDDVLLLGNTYNVMIIGKGDKPNTYQLSIKRLLVRRPRQNITTNRKPPSRKQLNISIINRYPFEASENKLEQQIEDEYERITNKYGKN